MRTFSLCAGVLLVAATAAAQTTRDVDVSASYRYLRVTTWKRATQQGQADVTSTGGMAKGFDLAAAVRLNRWNSIVAQFGTSWSSPILAQDTDGFVKFSIWDAMVGLKLSRANRPLFVQLSGGLSGPGRSFGAVSSGARGNVRLDAGIGKHVTLRPQAGFDLRSPSSRVGLHLESGWDFIFDTAPLPDSPQRTSASHFRLAVGAIVAVGKR